MKKPRLTPMDRLAIETGLNENKTFYAIGKELGKPAKTIAREVKARAVESDKGAVGRRLNRCTHRAECQKRNVCASCSQSRNIPCRACSRCNASCPDYVEDGCARLESPPFVCNGCKQMDSCQLRKRIYRSADAQKSYKTLLVESRKGANITENELLKFDELLYRLTQNGQSVHAVMVNNSKLFTVSEKTVYRYIDGGLLKTKNGDLPRKCKLRARKNKAVEHKVDAQCRIGRDKEAFAKFVAQHPGLPLVEMDTVEGVKGGKVLLTLMFFPTDFMLAFLLPDKTAASVCEVFVQIRNKLVGKFGKDVGLAIMSEMFFIVVTDNGTEFTCPESIETDCDGNRVANVFYTDAYASYQKPHCERNHEFIRLVLPKGSYYFLPTSFDGLTQDDVDTMMSHINSYVRDSLKDKTPYDLFTAKWGVEVADLFRVRKIPANEIVLKPKLLGLEQRVRPSITKETDPLPALKK